MKKTSLVKKSSVSSGYASVLADIAHLLESARRASVRTTNAIMTASYWEIGRRIVEHEQSGVGRAAYGESLLRRLSADLVKRFGRGFGLSNLKQIRKFYLIYAKPGKGQTLSGLLEGECQTEKSRTLSGEFNKPLQISRTLSAKFPFGDLAKRFPLPWSHYVMLLSIKKPEARAFYEAEALRGGWSVRQLDRQISSQFYERALLSRNKAAMIKKGVKSLPADVLTPEEEIKSLWVLAFCIRRIMRHFYCMIDYTMLGCDA